VILVVTAILAVAVRRASTLMRGQARIERERAAIARYFSPDVVDEIAKLDRPLGAVRNQNAAVLFADIVGFTGLSQRLGPEGTLEMLREFHRRMATAVFDHQGSVDKYIGDAVMATFGAPRHTDRDAANALRCAADMVDAVAGWNAGRVDAGEMPIRIGIGLHYGPVVSGDMGDDRRLEFAVIGDTVNVANRLEELTRERKVTALVSVDAVRAAEAVAPGLAGSLGLTPAPAAAVRGRAEPVALYALP
jgi:adenylate cyclase